MKFDYCKEVSLPGGSPSSSFPYTYHFQFSASCNQIEKVFHKYGIAYRLSIDDALKSRSKDDPYAIQWSLALLQDVFSDDGKVDLGIDYKKKYEELVELLKPYKLEDDMSPSTTLKMILKYQVK
jgi:hypothetical protein